MNFFSACNARPLSRDSRAMAMHSSISFSGSMIWMANAALTITHWVWAAVAQLARILSNMRAASSLQAPPRALRDGRP